MDLGYLYVIKDSKSKSLWYKVGKTNNPKSRLAGYNSSFPEDRMVYYILTERLYNITIAEREIIKLLSTKNIIRFSPYRWEWIKPSHWRSRIAVENYLKMIFKDIEDKYYYGDID